MDNRIVRTSLSGALGAIADLAMPRLCTVCGRELLGCEDSICTCCLADMPLTRLETLSHNPMADSLNARIAQAREGADGGTAVGADRYTHACALFWYRPLSGYSGLTQALKYRRDFHTGRMLAAMLGRRLASSPLYADVDLTVPVPLHWSRRLRRGYNQAEIIARILARELPAAQTAADLLVRQRRTQTQTLLDAEGKAANVRGAFRINGRRAAILEGKGAPRHILLVDDVFTTGATLHACYRALRPCTDARISVATLACVG